MLLVPASESWFRQGSVFFYKQITGMLKHFSVPAGRPIKSGRDGGDADAQSSWVHPSTG